jgi:hypothetical protein
VERVLDWWGERTPLGQPVDVTTEATASDRAVTLGMAGTGASHESATTSGTSLTESTLATVNRRACRRSRELANARFTLLLDDFTTSPRRSDRRRAAAKDAASRGVRICAPERAASRG